MPKTLEFNMPKTPYFSLLLTILGAGQIALNSCKTSQSYLKGAL